MILAAIHKDFELFHFSVLYLLTHQTTIGYDTVWSIYLYTRYI